MQSTKIGIMSLGDYKARTIAIAKGHYKPAPDEPKIWFHSIKSAASFLSEDNQALLRVIRKHHPESIAALSKLTGRKAGNLSRTLETLERYKIVRLEDVKGEAVPKRGRPPKKPVVVMDSASIELVF